MSNAIGRHARRGRRRKHGADTPRALREWTKANASARRWYQGVWMEETQEPRSEPDACPG